MDLCYFLVRAKLRYQQRLIRHLDLQRFSFYGLGSYLILIGLYLSALSVSEDDELRNYIKKSALQESKFLHSIGSSSLAEREREVMTRVLSKAKEQQKMLAENTGVKSSLTEEEIKEYVKTEEKVERE